MRLVVCAGRLKCGNPVPPIEQEWLIHARLCKLVEIACRYGGEPVIESTEIRHGSHWDPTRKPLGSGTEATGIRHGSH